MHRKAPLISGLPLREERAVVKPKAGGVFRDVDIDRGAGKESGGDERQLSCEHALVPCSASAIRNNRTSF